MYIVQKVAKVNSLKSSVVKPMLFHPSPEPAPADLRLSTGVSLEA